LRRYFLGTRILAKTDINVRSTPTALAVLGTTGYRQTQGVHGTITAGPLTGKADGFSGNWWQIDWDSGIDGWAAESFIDVVPTAGDILQPNLSTGGYYASDLNHFWSRGYAPISSNPPSPNRLDGAFASSRSGMFVICFCESSGGTTRL
jgi:hypothetical protein